MTADAINKKNMISTIPYFLYISPDDNLFLFFIFILIPFALLKAQNVMKKRWLVAAFFL